MGHDSPASAATNVVSPMQKLGLIDESGALTDRGNKWRGDATYAEACQEILDEVYPADLAGLTTVGGVPRQGHGDEVVPAPAVRRLQREADDRDVRDDRGEEGTRSGQGGEAEGKEAACRKCCGHAQQVR
jgi:hypothetical protein